MLTIANFRKISMRGRVAFALMCLEVVILHSSSDRRIWAWLMNRLWTYTSTTDLDEWQDVVAEMIPRVIMPTETYASEEFEHLRPEEFAMLRDLYCNCGTLLTQMVDLVFDIGTLELFGGIEDGAPISLENIEGLLRLMATHSLCTPDIAAVAEKSFDHCQGWGSPFPATSLTRLSDISEQEA